MCVLHLPTAAILGLLGDGSVRPGQGECWYRMGPVPLLWQGIHWVELGGAGSLTGLIFVLRMRSHACMKKRLAVYLQCLAWVPGGGHKLLGTGY